MSILARRARQQTLAARTEAKTSRELFGLSRQLTSAKSEDEAAESLARYVARAFDVECVVLARVGFSELRLAGASVQQLDLTDADMAAAKWTAEKGEPTGRGADTLPGARWLFLRLRTSRLVAGVVGVARASPLTPGERRRLAAMGDQTATALERAHVAQALEESRVETEAERLRGTMLASLSHDLRTPIAGILGAASSLRTYGDRHDPPTRDGLLASIESEATRMQRYVEKLLDMTRLDAGSIEAHLEPLDPSDVLAAVVSRAGRLVEGRTVRLDVEPDLPMVRADAALLDQALFNLVENALAHAANGAIVVGAARSRGGVAFTVVDEGRGIAPGDEARIFERFARSASSGVGGTGLGLAIVKGFASLMGAQVSAHNRSHRSGAVFTIDFAAERLA